MNSLRRHVVTKLCAISLLALAASPFTAPFQTCDLTADAASATGTDNAVIMSPTVAHTSLSDGSGLLVPTLATATGRLRLALVSALVVSNVVAARSPVAAFARSVRPPPHITGSPVPPTVLRV